MAPFRTYGTRSEIPTTSVKKTADPIANSSTRRERESQWRSEQTTKLQKMGLVGPLALMVMCAMVGTVAYSRASLRTSLPTGGATMGTIESGEPHTAYLKTSKPSGLQHDDISAAKPTSEVAATVASDSGSDDVLMLKVYNDDYSKAPASLGSGYYKWEYNLEPGRVNHMEVSVDSTEEDTTEYTWYVLDDDSSTTVKDAVHEKTAKKVSYTPRLNDAGSVFAFAVVRKDSSGAVLSTQRFQVACKYVRREFRELSEADKTSYFDALSIIYHTQTEEGKDTYGSKFRGSDYFVKKHLGAMTLEACTPWHDSEVFVTAHAAFNLEYEGSLRSIDESLSAHYWEITEDNSRYAENWATQSPIFSADMFGSFDFSTSSEHAYIADGRFTDVTFPTCDDDDASCPEHSIYGYMIDSNSYQSGATLERAGSACGIPTTSKLPGCQFAERAMSSKDLRKFWANVELRYHGDQHGLIGGVRGCKFEVGTELSEFAHNTTVMRYAEDIVLFMSIWGRTLFAYDDMDLGDYAGTVVCPHSTDDCVDDTDCTCSLPTVLEAIDNGSFDLDYAINVLTETSLYSDIAGARGWAAMFDVADDDGDDISIDNWQNAFVDLDTKQTEALLLYTAKQAAYHPRSIMAYALSLGSVNDPIFWAGHNSWERMWHWKRIESVTATDHEKTWWNSWNESDVLADSNAATCTWSSGAESTLPFYDLMKDESTENKYYTNKDMLRMFHPDNKALPHIYDSLEYNHCTGDLSDNDDVDVQHADFRTNLMSSVRKKMAQRYGAKVERGYTDHEATQLNSYYESLFHMKTLDNYEDRPIYEGTYSP
mmetsp:Transcript_16887/g.39463  ORF Transcript_16887/g.39463 Transcript_16887/m.39463 type:complete len:822 (+) Transcript_16887:116-2581(+)